MDVIHDDNTYILTVNVGSSSIKLAIFSANQAIEKLFTASIEDIAQPSARFTTAGLVQTVDAHDHTAAVQILLAWLRAKVATDHIVAVGHRIVHGGPEHHETQLVTGDLLASLQQFTAFDPAHLPTELQLIEMFQQLLPNAQQVVCFDTSFHYDMPQVAKLLPIPRHFAQGGVRRYGFHGLSYAFVLEELRRVEGEEAANGKVIIAHLGSGASLAALHKGKSIDTTMSMTPASGIPMSTRSGDIDPGLTLYLAHTQGYSAERFNRMVNFESGLLGISETTADMEELLKIETNDPRAKDAVDIFCYNVTKSIGSLSAALGGLNTLVFTGGMGENAPAIRERVCKNLAFLGINVDATRNHQNKRLISVENSPVGVHVIHTDESTTIARDVIELIDKKR